MRRSRIQSLLHDYVAGDLDRDAARDVERRIESEPETRALFEEIRDAHDALQSLRARRAPPVDLARIQTAIAAHHFEAKPKLYLHSERTRFYRGLAAAATVLFAVTATLFAVNSGAPEETTTRPEKRDLVEMGAEPEGISAEELLRRLENGDARNVRLPVPIAIPVSHNETR